LSLAAEVFLLPLNHILTKEASVVEPASQRSLNRVWILVLVIIVVVWVIYALAGGLSTPPSGTAADSVAEPRR
jgi:hypothetical protein